MTEIEYRKLLIDSVRAGDYPEKDGLLELLNICSLRFEKTNVFTRNLWNHFQEYIHICIVPEKMIELKKHADYLKKMIYEIYPPNDDSHLYCVGRSFLPTHNSELAAAVALLLTCGDGEERAEVYGCAADRQQAAIVFDVAADMVRMCPALNKRVKILTSAEIRSLN